MPSLGDINDDILIQIFACLSIGDILALRQVSKRMCAVSKLRIVWQRALETHVLDRGFPFPDIDVDAIDCTELEARTRKAFHLGVFWRTPAARPYLSLSFAAGNSATGIAQVRFLPAHPRCLITLSKGIWSVLTCWDMGGGTTQPRVVAEWTPKQTLITAIAVNSDPHSQAYLAVSLTYSGTSAQSIQILNIDFWAKQFVILRTIDTPFRAMTLHGNVLAASDDMNETRIIDWNTEDYAVLWGSDEPSEHNFQHNQCLQVVFAPKSVFVVRARSLEVFLEPTLHPHKDITTALYNRPIGCHRFGWIDGMSMSVQKQFAGKAGLPPLSIILRAESDDPWASDVHTLDLYVLRPNPEFTSDGGASWTVSDESCGDAAQRAAVSNGASADVLRQLSPYLFPPVRQASWVSKRGHLRCRDILLGSHGTAVWIQPRPARNLDLIALDVHASSTQRPGVYSPHGAEPAKERLVAALLPSRLRDAEFDAGAGEDAEGAEGVRTLFAFEGSYGMWRSVDYDEPRGLIALGDSLGQVDILELRDATYGRSCSYLQ